jgi:hypothetical protein
MGREMFVDTVTFYDDVLLVISTWEHVLEMAGFRTATRAFSWVEDSFFLERHHGSWRY